MQIYFGTKYPIGVNDGEKGEQFGYKQINEQKAVTRDGVG